ncbi:MAG: DUF4160 domain-containing protein [Porticoccaceae bacterium]
MSPTAFRERGYRFFVFSREERRLHVHVTSGDGEAKFWLKPAIQLANNHGYGPRQLAEIEALSREHHHELFRAWHNTSAVAVTHIPSHGVWLLAHGLELFVPYTQHPWFKDQPVKAILNAKEPSPGHYHGPEIDIDLSQDILEHPEQYPNIARR